MRTEAGIEFEMRAPWWERDPANPPPRPRASYPLQSAVMESDTAFVVMDALYKFCDGVEYQKKVDAALGVINEAGEYFDARNIPTLFIYLTPWSDASLPYEGLSDKTRHEYEKSLGRRLYRPRLSGIFQMIRKVQNSVFEHDAKTGYTDSIFGKQLAQDFPKVRNLVVGGFKTRACVYDSVIDAVSLGFNVSVLEDGTSDSWQHVPGYMSREAALKAMRADGAWVGTFAAYKARHLAIAA